MEIISCHSAPCSHASSLTGKTAEKSISLGRSKVLSSRNQCFSLDVLKSGWGSSRYPLGYFGSNSGSLNQASRSNSSLKVVHNTDSSVLTDGCDTYVTDDPDYVPKVLIPGLPDEPDGDSGAAISSCFWEWKPNFNVHYETSGSENVNSPAVLLLPGFGVGSFHYEKQLKDLGRDYRVWAVDFLGQGMSLPDVDPTPRSSDGAKENSMWGFGNKTEPWANQLVYSIDLWQEQVRYFIEEVIKEPVYLAGNSLGGYVALYFGACNPQLVKGITLLNATPFWGFVPNPKRSPRFSKIFPWAGTFPLPANVIKLVQFVWEKIRDPTSIGEILKQVYADHSTDVDKVFCRILETTEHPAAAASLASIMFAPQGELSFGDSLSRCQMNNVPICLMYGKEDPWVQPIWGLQVKRQVPEAPYYQISPAGHCPHDEVPEVVNYLLRGWIKNLESEGLIDMPLLENRQNVKRDISTDVEFLRQGSKRSARVRFYGSDFSLWNQMSSFINTRIKDIKIKFR